MRRRVGRLNNIFLIILSVSLGCSFIIVCVGLLNKILKKHYSRKWIYTTWILIALRLLLPFNISIIDLPEMFTDSTSKSVIQSQNDSNSKKTIVSIGRSITETREITDKVVDENTNIYTLKATKQLVPVNNINAVTSKNLTDILNVSTLIWILGAVIFLFYHLMAYFFYSNKLKRWGIIDKNEMLLDIFDSLRDEFSIKYTIKIIRSNQVDSPVLIGLIKPCIVLPQRELSTEQYSIILRHELIHYKHHDLYYKFILLLANSLHWFNPLVYYMVNHANNQIELYCDEKMVKGNSLDYREAYSRVLLYVMKGINKKNNLPLSTGFSCKKKDIKNRFYHIMHSRPTKKGVSVIVGIMCLIALVGNVTNWLMPNQSYNAQIKDSVATSLNEHSIKDKELDSTEQLEKPSNILVVGIDGTKYEDVLRADSILLVSISPISNRIYLTSFLRDTYVQIPGGGEDKLSLSYGMGGTKLLKETIETNFDMVIDHTVTINMKAFEDIINTIGGVNIELSEEEAAYLNTTNYISDNRYRNVSSGEKILNGNQALGYVRIRKISTLQGEREDLGRTARL